MKPSPTPTPTQSMACPPSFTLINENTINVRVPYNQQNQNGNPTLFQICQQNIPRELINIYKNIGNLYKNYLIKRAHLVAFGVKCREEDGKGKMEEKQDIDQQKDQDRKKCQTSYILLCKIPIIDLFEQQYPTYEIKLIQKQQQTDKQIQILKQRVAHLQKRTSAELSLQKKYEAMVCRVQCLQKANQALQSQIQSLTVKLSSLPASLPELPFPLPLPLPCISIGNTNYSVETFVQNCVYSVEKEMDAVVFVMGGGAAGGRGGSGKRGGGGSGRLEHAEVKLKKGENIQIKIGTGGQVGISQDINGVNDANSGNSTTFGQIVKAEGGKYPGISGILYGGDGGSGGGAGQGSNTNPGAKGGEAGKNGDSTNNSWIGGKGLSQQNFKKAISFGLFAGKGGNGGLGNPSGHQAGGGAGGLLIPEKIYKGITPSGRNGSGNFPGMGGQGFGAGGGGGSYDSATYHYGGNGAQGCVIVFIKHNP